MQSFIGDDGCLHLVADAEKLPATMQQLDLNQARVLSRLDSFWSERCRYAWPWVRSGIGHCVTRVTSATLCQAQPAMQQARNHINAWFVVAVVAGCN